MNLVQDLRVHFSVHQRGYLVRLKSVGSGGQFFRGQKVVGWLEKKGYRNFTFKQKTLKVHRAIFAIIHGYFPPEVDHKNRKRGDNRPNNLRAANTKINSHNKGLYRNNLSGISGINREKKLWRARIQSGGKVHHLGRSKNKKELMKRVKKFRQIILNEILNEDKQRRK